MRVTEQEMYELIAKQQIRLDQTERVAERLTQEYRKLAIRYAEMVEKYTPESEEAKQIREVRRAAEMIQATQSAPAAQANGDTPRPTFVDDVNGNI